MMMTYGEYRRLEKLRKARRLKRIFVFLLMTICASLGTGIAMVMVWLVLIILL